MEHHMQGSWSWSWSLGKAAASKIGGAQGELIQARESEKKQPEAARNKGLNPTSKVVLLRVHPLNSLWELSVEFVWQTRPGVVSRSLAY